MFWGGPRSGFITFMIIKTPSLQAGHWSGLKPNFSIATSLQLSFVFVHSCSPSCILAMFKSLDLFLEAKKHIKHASEDQGFIFITYNLKRILNINRMDALLELLASFLIFLKTLNTEINLKKSFSFSQMYFLVFGHNMKLSHSNIVF